MVQSNPRTSTRIISLKFVVVTLAVIAAIAHGSLYPYRFEVPADSFGEVAAGAVAALLASWATPPTSLGDLAANLLLYMPLGFFAAHMLRRGRVMRLVVAVVTGLLLSVAMELAQFYDLDRVTNMSDVYLNTTGAALGGLAALFVEIAASRPLSTGIAVRPIPLALLGAMLGYHLFPYVPTIDLHKYWQSLKPLVFSPYPSLHASLHYVALWLAAAWLLGEVLGFARSRFCLPVFVAIVFVSKVLIDSLVLTPSEVVGAAAAAVLWFVIGNDGRRSALFVAVVLTIAIIDWRLAPFQFGAAQRAFGWLPFGSFFAGSMTVNTIAFLEKLFFYGTLVWVAMRAGLRLWIATLLVAALLLGTSWAELYLPGRSAEITDALMAIIIGLIMTLVRVSEDQAAPPPPSSRPVTAPHQ